MFLLKLSTELANRKIKILFFSVGANSGGPVVSLIQLIQSLNKDKYEPYILSLANTNPSTLDALKDIRGIHILKIDIWINNWLYNNNYKYSWWHKVKSPGRNLRILSNSWKIRRLIKKHQIDLVHSNFELQIEGAIAAYISGKPHIWHIRAPLGKNGVVSHPFGLRFSCWVISFFSKFIITNSLTTERNVYKYIPTKKIFMIYNGISLVSLKKKFRDQGLRQILSIPRNNKIITSIGYLSKLKGGEEFLKIAIEICKKRKDITFVWIGPSTEREDDFTKYIFETIKIEQLERQILFTGERNNVIQLISDATLFLQPMVYGSWSRVVLEAMISKKVVIAIEPELNSEFIDHKISGILVKDISQAVSAILKVVDNPIEYEILAQKAYEKVTENYTNNQTAKKVENVYKKIFKI